MITISTELFSRSNDDEERIANASDLGFRYWPDRITLIGAGTTGIYQFLSFERDEKGEIRWGEYININIKIGDSLLIYND